MELTRSTRCEIRLDDVKHNAALIRRLAGEHSKPMAVLKANAYGHGGPEIFQYLLNKCGIEYFAVASLNEALELRAVSQKGYLLVLGYTPDRYLSLAVDNGIALCVASLEQGKALSALGKDAHVQLKVDSGMHRLGFSPTAEDAEQAFAICNLPHVTVDGAFTHLALKDRAGDEWQYGNFTYFLGELEKRGFRPPLCHISDGIGVVRYPQWSMDLVRPGGMFYGFGYHDDLRPIMTVRSEVARVQRVSAGEGLSYDLMDAADHDRVIATLPFGYADGVPRCFSHGSGYVTIRGQKAPYVGLMCMDMCMVDVTDIPGVAVDDPVVVYGPGENEFSFPAAAKVAQMNRNALTSGLAPRVPRVYLEGGQVVACKDYLLK